MVKIQLRPKKGGSQKKSDPTTTKNGVCEKSSEIIAVVARDNNKWVFSNNKDGQQTNRTTKLASTNNLRH